MGQCIQAGDRRERAREEESRSLMSHEEEDKDDSTTSCDVTSQSNNVNTNVNSHARPRPVRKGEGANHSDTFSPVRNRVVNGEPKEREMSDIASRKFEQQPATDDPTGPVSSPDPVSSPVCSQRGKEMMEGLSKAYHWREKFEHPSPEFLALMDRLYMECQLHLTALSSRGDLESRKEADMIVNEMVALRNYWGPQLLPSSTCNAFVRERIPLVLGVDQRQFRIDCAQFFEPVPFYGNQQSNCPGELMKLYRFSVYNVAKNEVVLRYFLERSNITQFYHVLCFMDNSCHGQVKPYGTEPPSYWDVRHDMLKDLKLRLLSSLSPGNHPVPKPLALTVFLSDRVGD